MKDFKKSKYTIDSIFLHPIKQVCAELCIDPVRLLSRVNLPPAALRNPDLQIDHAAFAQVLNEGVKVTGNELFGCLVGRQLKLNNIGVMGVLLANQSMLANIYPMLAYFLDAQNRGAIHKLVVQGDNAYHEIEYLMTDQVDCGQLAFLALSAFHNIFTQLFGDRWQPSQILLKQNQVKGISQISTYFGCPVSLHQTRYAIEFPASILYEAPEIELVVTSQQKTEVARILHQFDDIAILVENYIKHGLQHDECNKNSVAQALGVHPKVLQNCLHTKGTSFKHLFERTRKTIACELLVNTELTVADIALQIGYSESRVFVRAFKLWMGLTPLQWRKNKNTII